MRPLILLLNTSYTQQDMPSGKRSNTIYYMNKKLVLFVASGGRICSRNPTGDDDDDGSNNEQNYITAVSFIHLNSLAGSTLLQIASINPDFCGTLSTSSDQKPNS